MKAFTLIELIVVITMLWILCAVACVALSEERPVEDQTCVFNHVEDIEKDINACTSIMHYWECKKLTLEKYWCLIIKEPDYE